jgi:micrococcal nuclease
MKAKVIASVVIILILGSAPFVFFFESIQTNANDDDENCDSSYPDACIPSPPPELNCGEISDKRFKVLPPDPHGFDLDGDGTGCES